MMHDRGTAVGVVIGAALMLSNLLSSEPLLAMSHAGRSELKGGSTTYVRMSRHGPAIGNAYPGDYFYAASRSASENGFTWGYIESNTAGRGYTGCGWVDNGRLRDLQPGSHYRDKAKIKCGAVPLHDYRKSVTWPSLVFIKYSSHFSKVDDHTPQIPIKLRSPVEVYENFHDVAFRVKSALGTIKHVVGNEHAALERPMSTTTMLHVRYALRGSANDLALLTLYNGKWRWAVIDRARFMAILRKNGYRGCAATDSSCTSDRGSYPGHPVLHEDGAQRDTAAARANSSAPPCNPDACAADDIGYCDASDQCAICAVDVCDDEPCELKVAEDDTLDENDPECGSSCTAEQAATDPDCASPPRTDRSCCALCGDRLDYHVVNGTGGPVTSDCAGHAKAYCDGSNRGGLDDAAWSTLQNGTADQCVAPPGYCRITCHDGTNDATHVDAEQPCWDASHGICSAHAGVEILALDGRVLFRRPVHTCTVSCCDGTIVGPVSSESAATCIYQDGPPLCAQRGSTIDHVRYDTALVKDYDCPKTCSARCCGGAILRGPNFTTEEQCAQWAWGTCEANGSTDDHVRFDGLLTRDHTCTCCALCGAKQGVSGSHPFTVFRAIDTTSDNCAAVASSFCGGQGRPLTGAKWGYHDPTVPDYCR
jgi:hypothetical protein